MWHTKSSENDGSWSLRITDRIYKYISNTPEQKPTYFTADFTASCLNSITTYMDTKITLLKEYLKFPDLQTNYFTKLYNDAQALYLLLSFTMIVLFALMMKRCFKRNNKEPNNEVIYIKTEMKESEYYHMRRRFSDIFCKMLLLVTLVSIPWEFIRLYQMEMAKKVAVSIKDMPAECIPSTMTFWQEVMTWLRLQFSVMEDPCRVYHEALLVDPLWEVTPLVVVSSLISRCILKPLEWTSRTLGQCFRLIIVDIPLPWQPIIVSISVILLVLLLLMFCRYRVSVPLFFSLEPARQTPKTMKRVPQLESNECDSVECRTGRPTPKLMDISKERSRKRTTNKKQLLK